MKKITILYLAVFSFIINAQDVRVAAAGNLRFVIEEIKNEYLRKNPESNVIVSLASSGALFQQITNGAGYDIFMAADTRYPQKLNEMNFVSGEVSTYALGKLVLWSNTINISTGINVLASDSVSRISVAKPEVAPYGNRAVQCLNYFKIFDKVKNKIVYADNIAQAAHFAQTGNTEVGFLALSLTFAPGMEGSYYDLDPESYDPVEQALVLLKTGKDNPEAAKFIDFIFSDECRKIFEKFGYMVP